MLTYVSGDATRPLVIGPTVIAHAVNDAHKWGAGFVIALSRRWPHARADYLSHPAAIGTVRIVYLEPNIYLANLVCLHGVRSPVNPMPLSYDALKRCLRRLRPHVRTLGATVHMPRLGAGLAGGRWEIIEQLIMDQLADVQVTVYTPLVPHRDRI